MNNYNHLGAGIEKEDMFGGRGRFRAWPFRSVQRHAPFGATILCELAAKAHVGEVLVDDCSEIICVISGCAQVTLNGESHLVEAGQSIDIQRNARLALANQSPTEPLHYLLQKIS